MKKELIVGLLLLAFVCVQDVFAYEFQEPASLQSPNVATLFSYNEPEVSLYTGSPSINISLYDINLPGINLPIELQYGGSGIQVDQLPSWVGLGWNLSVGGVVARKINDGPDDITYDAEHFNYLIHTDGFYLRHDALNTDGWWYFDINSPSTNLDYAYYDSEPDEFNFRFLDYSGRFYINHLGELEVQCNKAVSVNLLDTMIAPPFYVPSEGGWSNMTKQPNCFGGFIIKTEDGTQFIFGNDTSAIDFCAPLINNQQTMVASAWHLTKIITSGKQEINLKYTRKKFTYELYSNYQFSRISFLNTDGWAPIIEGSFDVSKSVSGKLLSPVLLQEIQTPTLSVSFFSSEAADLQYSDNVFRDNYNASFNTRMMPYVTNYQMVYSYSEIISALRSNTCHYKLDRIKIQPISSSYSNNIYFDYTENDNIRLTLNSVQFQDGTHYSFTYNNIGMLPAYLSHMTDHWGYYNGTNSYNNSPSTSGYYSLREADTGCVKLGLLTDIKYPTGGVTHLEYESNDYRYQVAEQRWNTLVEHQSNKYGGGVRIKSISFFDKEGDANPVSKREYFYRRNYIYNPYSSISSGILGATFKYYYDKQYDVTDSDGKETYRYRAELSTTGNVLPFCSDDLSVCYSEITEKLSDGGYKVYKFTNFSDYPDEAPVYSLNTEDLSFVPCSSMRHMRGLLKEVADYSSNRTLVHKVEYSYTPNKDVNKFARSLYCTKVYLTDGQSYQLPIGASYKFYTHSMVPDTIREYKKTNNTIYDETVTVNHYSQSTQMLTKKQLIVNNDVFSTTYIYPFNLVNNVQGTASARIFIGPTNPPVSPPGVLASQMTNDHVYLPWEEISYKNGQVIGATFYDYSRSSNGIYTVDSVFSLGITSPLGSFSGVTATKQRDSHYHQLPDIRFKYGANGNVTEISEKGVTTSYIWGYNNTKIIAKVVGGSLSSLPYEERAGYLSYAGSSPTETEMSALRMSLSTSFPHAMRYTYTYHPLYGMSSETLPNNRTQYYSYDNMGRLLEIYIKNGTTKSILKKYIYHYSEE